MKVYAGKARWNSCLFFNRFMFVIILELNKKKYRDAVYSAQNKHFQTAQINPLKLWCFFFFA